MGEEQTLADASKELAGGVSVRRRTFLLALGSTSLAALACRLLSGVFPVHQPNPSGRWVYKLRPVSEEGAIQKSFARHCQRASFQSFEAAVNSVHNPRHRFLVVREQV